MWTKNGAKTLPSVLRRIEQVIPPKNVGNRIIVDDESADATCQIAQQHRWRVVPNEGSGISDAANTALRLVDTDWFASFEQDVLLSAEWWPKIPLYLSNPRTAVASGLRFPSSPPELRKLEEYNAEKHHQWTKQATEFEAGNYGKTLDNTVYKTSMIRKLGGFPKPPVPAGIDTILSYRLQTNNLKWTVDFTVRSVHFRNGIRDELRHDFSYAKCFDALHQAETGKPSPLKSYYKRFLLSPARGLEIAITKKAPRIIIIYPLVRLTYLRGVVASRRIQNQTESLRMSSFTD